ncbi:MAG: molybdopterin-dependent oxidoreductase [Pseudomonadota bacterium]|nr:molybdopterin-dependent oxidoreductase [Pseudomonadota bacterium]
MSVAPASERFSFVLDGAAVTVDADPKAPALGVLRDQLGVRGCKAGCSPQGLCGACTVLIEGKPRLTCTLPTKSLAGKSVTTLDGMPEADRAVLAEAFVRAGATQCGYCTPGIVLSAWTLLQAEASPSPEQITRALNQHACRCTGYTAIYAAIDAAAAVRRGEGMPLPAVARPEGHAITLGDRPYVDDLVRPGMLHGTVVLAPVARGRITTLDVDAALAMGATVEVFRAVGDVLAHAGEIVAGVAAETLVAAKAAAAAIVVHVEADLDGRIEVLARGRAVDGDVAAGLAASAHTAEQRYTLAATDPVYLEPESALAVPVIGDDGIVGLTVYSQGHDAAAEARALTERVGRPVRVRLVPSGGSYGGKEAMTVAPVAARLAVLTGRPVRVAVGLEAGMRLHRRRPAAEVVVRAGCDAAGGTLVLEVEVAFDGGADAFAADRIVGQALGAVPYRTAAHAIDARVVGSATSPTGPIRGAGGIAVAVAVERALDQLAARAGIDAFALRAANLEGEGAAVLAALEPRWREKDADIGARGLGLARVDGSGGARVVLSVTGPGAVEVACNVPELGQGRDETLLAALVASTGLAADVFEFVWADSDVVGAGALASAPVDGAARRAGEALAAGGGPLRGRMGRRYVGEDLDRGLPGWAASLVKLDAEGALQGVWIASAVGEGQDPRLAARLAEGAAHMGVGVALSEAVDEVGGLPEGRFRMLGILRPKGSPPLHALAVSVGAGHREIAEVVVMAVPAAVANAVASAESSARTALPMKDSAAARGVGVRLPRPAPGGVA